MEACEYCGTHDRVDWDDEAGHICDGCSGERAARARANAIAEFGDEDPLLWRREDLEDDE